MVPWPSKLLLFGEYTVLLKGEALAIPLSGMSGHWSMGNQVDSALMTWARWLSKLDQTNKLPWSMEISDFLRFAEGGGTFVSTIPNGSGLGSSGALVAGLAQTYSKELPKDLSETARGLALLEKYFHGSSSGLDPLVSLTRKAIHKENDTSYQVLDIPKLPERLFLVDSSIPRQTSSLVNSFRLKLEKESERSILLMDLMPQVHRAIHAVLTNDLIPFRDAFTAISRIQSRIFKEMIPAPVLSIWEGPGYRLKLCGAGGGGFFLGYAPGGQIPDLPFPVLPLTDLL